ncbi:MAG: hypothetical protein WA459_24395, partial [Stellaceae bacterium]
DQPRVPAGNPDGGQWTGGDGGGSESTGGSGGPGPSDLGAGGDANSEPAVHPGDAVPWEVAAPPDPGMQGFNAHLIEVGYPLSQEMWAVARNLYRLFRDSGGDIAALRAYLEDRGLQLDELPDVLRSAFDPPRPLSELQTAKPPRGFDTEAELRAYLGLPPPGYEWHHMIKQNGQFRPDLTSPDGIRTWIQNTNNMVAVPVIKHYCISGLMSAGGGSVRLRDVVRAHDPDAQREIGVELLRMCRVIP